MRYYYGIRYQGGNRSCTTGQPNLRTGRMSRAVEIVAFPSKALRDSWVEHETFVGSMAGERISATLRTIRQHRLGDTPEEFDDFIRLYVQPMAEMEG